MSCFVEHRDAQMADILREEHHKLHPSPADNVLSVITLLPLCDALLLEQNEPEMPQRNHRTNGQKVSLIERTIITPDERVELSTLRYLHARRP